MDISIIFCFLYRITHQTNPVWPINRSVLFEYKIQISISNPDITFKNRDRIIAYLFFIL